MEDSSVVVVATTELGDWTDFFVAMAGAAAALAGLFFVAISINVKEILAYESLPRRAGQAVALLMSSLVVAGTALLPGLSIEVLGALLLVVTGVVWAFAARLASRELRAARSAGAGEMASIRWRVVYTQAATIPGLVGAAMLLGGTANGLYVVAAGILVSFVVAVIAAWVLLIEILR